METTERFDPPCGYNKAKLREAVVDAAMAAWRYDNDMEEFGEPGGVPIRESLSAACAALNDILRSEP